MAGSAERSRRGETVENVALDLLAVVAGLEAGFLIDAILGQAGRVGLLPLLTIFAAFTGVGWWRSWQACFLAVLFGASFVWVIRPAQPAGFLPPLVLAASGLVGALVGAGLGALARRLGRREDPAALAARRRREAFAVMAVGVALALVPFAVGVVLKATGDPAVMVAVGFLVSATWPVAALLFVLGFAMLGRR